MKRIGISLLFVVILLGQLSAQLFTEDVLKFGRTLALVDRFYVDSTNQEKLTEKAIIEVLKNLDPHSVYFSKEELQEVNERLEGSYEGIGIEFNVLYDSILVISPMPGGPSEKAGLRPGDRIVSIENENVAGIGITTTGVRKRLLGDKGTRVKIEVFRRGSQDILKFEIIRDKLPVNSVIAAYMLDKRTGYIKLSNFALTTEKEFNEAISKLEESDMRDIIIDLRGNTGGYLEAAIRICDDFFAEEKLIVYLEGLKTPRQDFSTRPGGKHTMSKVAILVDEGSASASEIVAGAIQDWDRGMVVGRRTFGKGLVQNAFNLGDGSAVRLTIARYYTPTGRLIQRPYDKGTDKYMSDFFSRYSNGELVSADSIHFPDSLKFKTLVNQRTVFGGGGIMPDIFVPADTTWYSDYYRDLITKNVITEFMLDYVDKNRVEILSLYPEFSLYSEKFSFSSNDINEFIEKGNSLGAVYSEEEYEQSEKQILKILKGLVARDIWDMSEYYEVVNSDDREISTVLEYFNDEASYTELLMKSRIY